MKVGILIFASYSTYSIGIKYGSSKTTSFKHSVIKSSIALLVLFIVIYIIAKLFTQFVFDYQYLSLLSIFYALLILPLAGFYTFVSKKYIIQSDDKYITLTEEEQRIILNEDDCEPDIDIHTTCDNLDLVDEVKKQEIVKVICGCWIIMYITTVLCGLSITSLLGRIN
jgi:hypothetical protein